MTERLTPGKSGRTRPDDADDRSREGELLNRVRAGHSESFAEIVHLYQDRIFNTCWRICGNLEDARDLTQEAFLKAFERLDSFQGQSAFYTWLFRIAVNLAISFRRTAGRRRDVSLEALPEGTQARQLTERRTATTTDAAAAVAQADSQSRVVAALRSLDDEFRAVVVLRDIEELGYHEIGVILEIPYGTVKSRLHRARQALRASLESDSKQPGDTS